MSATHDEDSQMSVSPEDSDNDMIAASNLSVPSPPDSAHRSDSRSAPMQTQPFGASVANSNGKRPLNTISNGKDDAEELAAVANGKARQEHAVKTHAASGYTWTRPEDEPGYAWKSKKAVDDYERAAESVVHHEYAIKNRYGDPLELAAREQALYDSLKNST